VELTLAEVERITGVSRYQISRYTTDGRLQRTRQGHYEGASLAHVHPPFDRFSSSDSGFVDSAEAREVWLVRAKHAFRRELVRIVEERHRKSYRGFGWEPVTDDEREEIAKAVKEYGAILAAAPERR
jgi:hypothetical protein